MSCQRLHCVCANKSSQGVMPSRPKRTCVDVAELKGPPFYPRTFAPVARALPLLPWPREEGKKTCKMDQRTVAAREKTPLHSIDSGELGGK